MKVPLFKICRKEGRGKNFDEDYHWCTKIDPVQSFVPKFSILCETVHTRVYTWYVCSQGYILGTCVHKVHTWYVCSPAQLFDKNPQRLCGWWLPNKAVWNAKDLILKFCHSFRDIASPLAPNSRGPKMAHQRTTVERH